ncbi:MAG: redoxin domain-containing protein [Prolixibacteraceae bacterium]|jgi:peroxiredoxin|nr:redoxin domain-containing protein [Prolixibacteraceae bacterium]MBT6004702.1 redoxin domain-containing protein [Prolixibacteraceae bacterium]MBT6765089.1 redoxin domain-containing protein [Prolixibacteraceae bacterium]MBT6997781.1 redoxin domain-containing protein [Prolixibacteraceae bacterium]MBT7396421.1 redoxin domain-containing protein [Prolixibacteraceae bacterium]
MRKILKLVIVVLLLLIVGYLIYNVTAGYKNSIIAEQKAQTLPNVQFISLEGASVNLQSYDKNIPLVIIYFHPGCEHCRYEANEVGQNAAAFKNCQLVMVTADDSLQRVKQFCNTYHLWEVDNIEVLLDKNNLFKKNFGKAIIPSVYIYNRERKLKKKFLGETKPEAIIEEIQDY